MQHEKNDLNLERLFPTQLKWKFRGVVDEDMVYQRGIFYCAMFFSSKTRFVSCISNQFLGIRDIVFNKISGRLTASAHESNVFCELTDVTIDLSVYQFCVRGKGATATMLEALMSPSQVCRHCISVFWVLVVSEPYFMVLNCSIVMLLIRLNCC